MKSKSFRHRISVEAEKEMANESATPVAQDEEPATQPWQSKVAAVERLLEQAPFAHAPEGLAERVIARIRQAMTEDMERLPSEAHEAIAQAYAIILLSTIPVLFSASWAVAHSTNADEKSLSIYMQQLSGILQSTADDLRANHHWGKMPREDLFESEASRFGGSELAGMAMALIPLTMLKVFGEALSEMTAGWVAPTIKTRKDEEVKYAEL